MLWLVYNMGAVFMVWLLRLRTQLTVLRPHGFGIALHRAVGYALWWTLSNWETRCVYGKQHKRGGAGSPGPVGGVCRGVSPLQPSHTVNILPWKPWYFQHPSSEQGENQPLRGPGLGPCLFHRPGYRSPWQGRALVHSTHPVTATCLTPHIPIS